MPSDNIFTPAAESPQHSESPINIINDRLGQARATLDLIHTGLNDSGFAEGLYSETLGLAVYSAILRIDEAREGKCGVRRFDSNGDRYWRKMLENGKLLVTRLVTTMERARRLPGVQPGIADDLIDWLEAHPGKVLTQSDMTTCGMHRWISHYGTAEALAAERYICDAGELPTLNNARRLLNGYWEYFHCEPMAKPISPKARPSYLRLVVDNDARVRP